jgi:hypothetical protein
MSSPSQQTSQETETNPSQAPKLPVASDPLDEYTERELLLVLTGSESKDRKFLKVCNELFDDSGRWIFGSPGSIERRIVQQRRRHLLRHPHARRASLQRFLSPSIVTPSPHKSTPLVPRRLFSKMAPAQSTPIDIDAPIIQPCVEMKDGTCVNAYKLHLNKPGNVNNILTVHGRDIRTPGRLTDKLQVMEPIIDARDKTFFLAWLSDTGGGMFRTKVSVPHFLRNRDTTKKIQAIVDGALKSDGTIDDKKLCDNILSNFEAVTTSMKTEKDSYLITEYYQFPDGMTCNNELFNSDKKGNKPPNMYKLMSKVKMESIEVGEAEGGALVIGLMPFMVWEMAVDNEDDKERHTEITEEDNDEEDLSGAMAGLGIKMKKGMQI